MHKDTHTAVLLLSLAIIFVIFGCLGVIPGMDESKETGINASEPPFEYNPLEEEHKAILDMDSANEITCSPQNKTDYCEGQTRYYDFECVNGEWQYKLQECKYNCVEGACINIGCPPCADGNPCTRDFCDNNGKCSHIPIPDCGKISPTGQKTCKPVAGPGSYIIIDVYPTGATSNQTIPAMHQKLEIGQKLQVDEDDSIYFESVYLEGTCPKCYYPPVLKWPASVKITTTKDLSGELGTYLKNEGEMGYLCISGRCDKKTIGGCQDYVCKTPMKFTISEMNLSLECS